MTDLVMCAMPNCEHPVLSGFTVCTSHGGKLRALLRDLPAMMADLEHTIVKQDRTTKGARGKGHEFALPFAQSASDDAWTIGNTVSSWARIVREQFYPEPPETHGPLCVGACFDESCQAARLWLKWLAVAKTPITFATLCTWLAKHVEWLRRQPFAPEAFDELLSIRQTVQRAIDTRGYRYIGPCTALVVTVAHYEGGEAVIPGSLLAGPQVRPCGEDLRLYYGAKTIRCKACGSTYDADNRMAWALDATRDELATTTDIAQALRAAGRKMSDAKLRMWAARVMDTGELDQDEAPIYRPILPAIACQVSTHRPLYRVGDVLDVMAAKEAGQPLISAVRSRADLPDTHSAHNADQASMVVAAG